MDIAVDFDGTVVTHEYPNVGEDVENAVNTLHKMVHAGYNIIINTMRSGKELADAIEWYNTRGIKLYGVNVNPTQHKWTSSPKVYAQISIDDINFGCPVRWQNGHRVVDWFEIERELFGKKMI